MKCIEHITKPPTERPLVTVITPYYKNSLQEIRQTIQSVASQRYPRIQYILVDDGSPCVAPEEIKRCLSGAPQLEESILLRQPENQGTVKALNLAYKHAQGRYIFNLAADDLFADENVLEDWVTAFQQTDAQVITGYRVLFDQELKQRLRKRPKQGDVKIIQSGDSRRLYRSLCRKNTILGCCTAYSAQCLQQYGFFDEQYRIIEDYPRVLALSRQGARFAFLPREVVHCRTGGISSGAGYSEMYQKDADLILKKEILPYVPFPLWAKIQYEYWKIRQRLLKSVGALRKKWKKGTNP